MSSGLMGARRLAAAGCLVGALALGVGACGGDDSGGSSSSGGGGNSASKELTIYSSMPLQGASSAQSESIVNGEKLALEQSGGKVAADDRLMQDGIDLVRQQRRLRELRKGHRSKIQIAVAESVITS